MSEACLFTVVLPCSSTRSTLLVFLQQESCLPRAQDLLDCRQTRYALRTLNADGDHPMYQLLPTNYRLGELYRHEGTTSQPSSTGWTRLEKTHRSFGSRLAQQIVRHVAYDAEYGFELPCKTAPPEATPVIWAHGYSQVPERMRPGHLQQMTLFVSANNDATFGVGAVWEERNGWKTKAVSLGKYLTETDVALFAASTVIKDLSILFYFIFKSYCIQAFQLMTSPGYFLDDLHGLVSTLLPWCCPCGPARRSDLVKSPWLSGSTLLLACIFGPLSSETTVTERRQAPDSGASLAYLV
jgi:hypothetical protein